MKQKVPADRITLLYMIDNLRPGGAQKVLLSLISALDRTRVDPVLWCLGGTSEVRERFRDAGVRVIRFHPFWLYTGAACLYMLLFARLRRVALIHTFLFHADNVGRVIGRLAGVPVVISSVRATNVYKKPWQLRLDRVTARWAHAVTAVSRATLEFAVEREGVPRERTVFIPNGVDTSSYRQMPDPAEVRRELGFPEDAFVVGSLGRLHEQKGYAYLIDAAARLTPEYANVHFFIAGYGPLEEALRTRIEALGLSSRVRLLGYRRDVMRLLSAMDLFVLPSLWEGMPNALLEAMAAGKPAVATRVDGNVDLVVDGETGLLTPSGDAAALAEAMARFLSEASAAGECELAREMGRRARERAQRVFSIKRMVIAYANLYNGLLAEKLACGWAGSVIGEER